jgi:hypothetical protein
MENPSNGETLTVESVPLAKELTSFSARCQANDLLGRTPSYEPPATLAQLAPSVILLV